MARLLIAFYQNEPLTAWMLFNFKDTLYYPYGGSTKTHPEVMANNLVAWEAVKLGKRLNLKKFDMWGALGPNAKSNDPCMDSINLSKATEETLWNIWEHMIWFLTGRYICSLLSLISLPLLKFFC